MKIVVCVKYVPDAASHRSFTEDNTTDRVGVDSRLSELDEYAVEQALRIVESGTPAEITYLTMGGAGAAAALRTALSMGGDRAIHIRDEALHGTDYAGTSLVLAKAVEKAGFDLVLCGMASTDGVGSVVPAMMAERLGVPQMTLANELSVADGIVRIRRDGDTATERVEAPLPAVASVTDRTGDPRYPSFKGIMASKKKPVETWSLDDLGLAASEVGLSAAWTRVEQVTECPPRAAGTVVKDEGDGGIRLAGFLADEKFI